MPSSFRRFLLSQWNLFPSTFLSARKITFPSISVVDTERRAVLSRIPVPLHAPLAMTSVTSSSGFFPDALLVGATVRLQKGSPLSANGSSSTTTLDRPGVVPPIVGAHSEQTAKAE